MYRATHIIHSPNPFRVPHIIINQPPPEDPCVVLNDPQDYGYGRYLVVRTHGVSYINEPEDDASTDYPFNFDDYGAEDFGDNGNEHDELEDYGESYQSTLESYRIFDDDAPELDADSLSAIESPFPETPGTAEAEDFRTAFERALDKRAPSLSYSSSFSSSSLPTGSLLETFSSSPSSLHLDDTLESPILSRDDSLDDLTFSPVDEELFDELEPIGHSAFASSSSWADEEDDLPSLEDEFYQSVIRRTHTDDSAL